MSFIYDANGEPVFSGKDPPSLIEAIKDYELMKTQGYKPKAVLDCTSRPVLFDALGRPIEAP